MERFPVSRPCVHEDADGSPTMDRQGEFLLLKFRYLSDWITVTNSNENRCLAFSPFHPKYTFMYHQDSTAKKVRTRRCSDPR